MDQYKVSHAAKKRINAASFQVKHGALSAGSDLYRARMGADEAQTYCGSNPECSGFTWMSAPSKQADGGKGGAEGAKELPLVFFKSGLSVEAARASMNTDSDWTSYIKLGNATDTPSAAGSLLHGPEGCRIAGHLNVRKVPGTLKLALHTDEHDHEAHLINSSHFVSDLWFGEPLSRSQFGRLAAADQSELLSPTSHRLEVRRTAPPRSALPPLAGARPTLGPGLFFPRRRACRSSRRWRGTRTCTTSRW